MEKILNLIKKYIPKKLFRALQPAYHFCLSWLAALWYRYPSEKLIVVGVTGTSGKTTTVYLLAKALAAAGHKTGFTSTAMFNDGKKEWLNDKKMTMPGRFFTQRMLRNMLRNKCQYAIVETTSEGIRQFRHRFINYDILIFTCLYPEHIDSHGSFENYKQAKGSLFAHLKRGKTKYIDEDKRVRRPKSGLGTLEFKRVKKTIIANGDDKEAEYFLSFWAEQKFAYAQDVKKISFNSAGVNLVEYGEVQTESQGVKFKTGRLKIKLRLGGGFNVTNAMNIVCFGQAQDIDLKKIRAGLESVSGIPGRLETIEAGQKFGVIVDYAFEPRQVAGLYKTVALTGGGKIIHVLGACGGGRDVARRAKLGEIAGQKAAYVIVTNEDPYDDDPQVIIDQVAAGAERAGKKLNKNLFKILDRRQAIRKALNLAADNDIVLITGKGSEQAICAAGGKRIKWDDREVVREELTRLRPLASAGQGK